LENPTHVYTTAGVYTVTLTVGGPGGTDTLTRANYITVSEPSCDDVIANGGFEDDGGWELPVVGGYTTTVAHDGDRSMLLGITNPDDDDGDIYASTQQETTILTETISATLRLWLYPMSEEEPGGSLPSPAAVFTLQEAALEGDVQYVILRDENDQEIDTLLWQRSDDRAWTFHEFDLTAYAGQTIKLNVGVYNDGAGGVTAMYLDDVSLEICYP
jgi:PKD repeat protein